MATETIIDLVIVGIVLLSGLFALFRGLVKEVLSIGSWTGAVFVTLYGFTPVRPIFRDLISWPGAADITTWATLFIGSLFIFSLIAHQISKRVQNSAIGALDRTLGFVFGLIRGVLISVVLFMAISWAVGTTDQPRWFRQARTLPLVAASAELILALVPDTVRKSLPKITKPEPATKEKEITKPGQQGYRPSVRRGMERLIDGTQ